MNYDITTPPQPNKTLTLTLTDREAGILYGILPPLAEPHPESKKMLARILTILKLASSHLKSFDAIMGTDELGLESFAEFLKANPKPTTDV